MEETRFAKVESTLSPCDRANARAVEANQSADSI